MSALRQVEDLLPSLSRAEKAQLLRTVVQDLDDAFPGIDSLPGGCGGEPCIVRTRIPVWALEQARRLGITEDQLLRSYPTLRAPKISPTLGFSSAPTAPKLRSRSRSAAPATPSATFS